MNSGRQASGANTGQELHTTYLGATGSIAAGKDAQAVIIADVESGDTAPVSVNENDLAAAAASSQSARTVFGNSGVGSTTGGNNSTKAQVQVGASTFGAGQPTGSQSPVWPGVAPRLSNPA